jgi:dUTP pyrophosphatase
MKQEIKLGIKRLFHSEGLPLPKRMTHGSSGADIYAANDEPITIKPLERVMVPTGLIFETPDGFEVQIRPRSGLAAKFGVTVLNTPGTIDADYRGEVKIILINLSNETFTVNRGERIAQAVVAEVAEYKFIEVDDVNETDRGAGGFGHTGKE